MQCSCVSTLVTNDGVLTEKVDCQALTTPHLEDGGRLTLDTRYLQPNPTSPACRTTWDRLHLVYIYISSNPHIDRNLIRHALTQAATGSAHQPHEDESALSFTTYISMMDQQSLVFLAQVWHRSVMRRHDARRARRADPG